MIEETPQMNLYFFRSFLPFTLSAFTVELV